MHSSKVARLKSKARLLRQRSKNAPSKSFINRFVDELLAGRSSSQLQETYNSYAREIVNLQDISRWSFKKTITSSVLNPARAQEQKAFDALEGQDIQMGDKHYFYFDCNDALKLQQHWAGDHNVDRLLEKLFKTVKVFETVVNVKTFHNYKLKRNKPLLLQLQKQSA
jgi:hypothetical protein